MVADTNRFEKNSVRSCMGIPNPFVIVSHILVFSAAAGFCTCRAAGVPQ
jgi:AMMECR1 domain-containing protein